MHYVCVCVRVLVYSLSPLNFKTAVSSLDTAGSGIYHTAIKQFLPMKLIFQLYMKCMTKKV